MRTYALLLLVACAPAGKSGLPADTELGELDEAEWEEMCTWVAANSALEEEEVKCDGYTATVYPITVEECLTQSTMYTGCSATVEDLEECTTASVADPCAALSEASCLVIFACAMGG